MVGKREVVVVEVDGLDQEHAFAAGRVGLVIGDELIKFIDEFNDTHRVWGCRGYLRQF